MTGLLSRLNFLRHPSSSSIPQAVTKGQTYMATRYFCDGCGKEPDRAADLTKVTVAYGEHQNNSVKFDLCGGCLTHFKNNRLPTTWPKAEPAKAE